MRKTIQITEVVPLAVGFISDKKGAVDSGVMLLKEKTGDRVIILKANPLGIISTAPREMVEGLKPHVYDLLYAIIDASGLVPRRAVISEVINEESLAILCFDMGGKEIHLNADATDAVMIALKYHAPIFVSDDVLEQHGKTEDEAKEQVVVSAEINIG